MSLEISKRRRAVKRALCWRAVKPSRRARGGALFLLAALALACASDKNAKVERSAPVTGEVGAFPPVGPIVLRPSPPPNEGTLFQALTSYSGRTEVTEEGDAAHPDAQTQDEEWALQLDYRQLPVPAPEGSLAESLVLEALKRRARLMPPGKEHVVEIADDRLRVSENDKVGTDLRGAQPKEDLTPRQLLGKSFAMLVTDSRGNPTGFTVRAVPSAKKILGSMNLREPLTYLALAYPEHPVAPGDTWREKRYFPNPVGRLGLGADIEIRLIGYDKILDAPCAHLVLRASLDAKDVKSDSGFTFDEVRYAVQGDAWIDLRNGQLVQERIEDIAAVSHKRAGGSMIPARVRMRYEGRSALQRLDTLPDSAKWADGTKRFSAVK